MSKKKQLPRRINAPVFSYWQALYMAFYSNRLYVDVAKRWRGAGFIYLLLMLAVACIPLSIRFILDANQFIEEQIIAPLKTIPPLELHDGEISLNKPMPYVVRSKTGAVVAMIDTRTIGSGMQGTYPELMMLITKDKFYFRPPIIKLFSRALERPAGEEPIVEIPEKNTFEILILSNWLESSGILNLRWMLAGLIYPFLVSFLFGMFFSFFLMVTMLAQVFSWLFLRFRIPYTQALRILIVSSTVQLSVLLLLLSANILFSGLAFVCLALCVLYFSYGILSVKRESMQLVRS